MSLEDKNVPSELLPLATPRLGTHRQVKMGMVHPKAPPQVLRLKGYLLSARVSTPPAKVDYYGKSRASLDHMYLNDRYGCCVISGKGHSLGCWSGEDTGTALECTDKEILDAYSRLKAGPGDSGCVISDVLDAWKQGIRFSGQLTKIDGYVAIDWTNPEEVKVALFIFGPLTVGFNVPSSYVSNAAEGAVWDLVNDQIVGGHDVSIVGYDEKYVYVSTWGVVLKWTWRAFASKRYVTECYAILSPFWYGADNKAAANGFPVEKLRSDLDKLTGGEIPDPGPVTPPSPPAPPVPPPPPAPKKRLVFVGDPTKTPTFGGTIVPKGHLEEVDVPAATAGPDHLDGGDWGDLDPNPPERRRCPAPGGCPQFLVELPPFSIKVGSMRVDVNPAKVQWVRLFSALRKLKKDAVNVPEVVAVLRQLGAAVWAFDTGAIGVALDALYTLVWDNVEEWPVIWADLVEIYAALDINFG